MHIIILNIRLISLIYLLLLIIIINKRDRIKILKIILL